MEKLRTVWLESATDENFKSLFRSYFQEFGMKMPDKGFLQMDADNKQYGIKLIVLYKNHTPTGFCMFQVDRADNPWCMHEGCGDIREFYVVPEERKKGYGAMMFKTVKNYFSAEGIHKIYLTSDDNEAFWIRLGFSPTGAVIEENGGREYVYSATR